MALTTCKTRVFIIQFHFTYDVYNILKLKSVYIQVNFSCSLKYKVQISLKSKHVSPTFNIYYDHNQVSYQNIANLTEKTIPSYFPLPTIK